MMILIPLLLWLAIPVAAGGEGLRIGPERVTLPPLPGGARAGGRLAGHVPVARAGSLLEGPLLAEPAVAGHPVPMGLRF